MKNVLIVEDEVTISRVLGAYLRKANYLVEFAYSGEEALRKFDSDHPSLVLLDVMMPELNGWEVLRHIREKSSCPVIMLTALSDTEHKLNGFEFGADDYITKPFIGEEVVARVNAVLRRATHMLEHEHTRYYGSLKINFQSQQVFLNGVEVSLLPRDLSLFLFLVKYPNQTFLREQLIEQVWGMDYEGSDRAVDLSIKRIRKALNNWPLSEGEIRTMRRLGYQFYVEERGKK